MYDDYKCSFGFPFLLSINKNNQESKYALNFTDVKSNFSFMFRKILNESERDSYGDRQVLHKPLEDDFSEGEMKFFMGWFMFYLVGFMKTFTKYYNEEFVRSLDYCFIIYGYKEKQFFLEQYDNHDDYYEAKSHMEKNKKFPFNCTKNNN